MMKAVEMLRELLNVIGHIRMDWKDRRIWNQKLYEECVVVKIKVLCLFVLILCLFGCNSIQSSIDTENNSVVLKENSKIFIYPSPQPESLNLEEIDGGVKVQIIEERDE